MRTFLHLSYDGAPWHGWQRQPEAASVQQQVERALGILLRQPTDIVGAGRTDTGVHAEGQWAHFDHAEELPERFYEKMNGVLPPTIAVRGVYRPAHANLHARFDAVSRSYRYQIARAKDPFAAGRRLHVLGSLDLGAMGEATALLLETTDFASFCKSGADNGTTLCTLTEARWHAYDEPASLGGQPRLDFYVTANRFLRGMVRALVGTVLDVGRGKLSISELEQVIFARDRSAAGTAAAPEGLTLTEVRYPPESLAKIMPES